MVPATILPKILLHLEWRELLFVASVCTQWKDFAGKNSLWKEQLRRNRSMFTIDALNEFEKLYMYKQQEEVTSRKLKQDVDKTYSMIGLLVRHTLSHHSYQAMPSPLPFNKARSEGDFCFGHFYFDIYEVKVIEVMITCWYIIFVVTRFLDLRTELKNQIAIFQTIIYWIEKVQTFEIENIQSNRSLFRWNQSTLKLHPNVVLNTNNTVAFLQKCSTNTGPYFRSIFIGMMKAMKRQMSLHYQLEKEIQALSSSALDLNVQLQGYNRYMKDILFRYSFISMNKEAKFSMRKLAKKGVLISSSLTEEQAKNASFKLNYAALGAYHLHIYGKQIDVILLEMGDLLTKVCENILATWFDTFLLGTANTLRLLERYMLKR